MRLLNIGYFCFIFIIFSYGCRNEQNAIEYSIRIARNNKNEIEKVIQFYKSKKDKEKLKAAIFLISNMQNKYHTDFEIDSQYRRFLNEIKNVTVFSKNNDSINKIIKDKVEVFKKQKRDDNITLKADLETLNAEFIIKNIEWSFKVWRELPWARNLTFEHFCESILPYKIYDEPVIFYREYFYNQFQWLLDSMKTETDPLKVCMAINNYIAQNFYFSSSLGIIPYLNPIDQYKYMFGICEHRYILTTAIMRSLGLAVGIDFTPQYNNWAGGHSWMYIIDKNGNYRHFNGGDLDHRLNDCKIPIGSGTCTKVYRKTFKNEFRNINPTDFFENTNYLINNIDVTNEYCFSKTELEFRNLNYDKSYKYVWLATFGFGEQIIPISFLLNNRNVKFKNIGNNAVYVLVYLNNNNLQILTNPVLCDSITKINLIPDYTHLQTIKLYRKYPPGHYPSKIDIFARHMQYAEIQASNDKYFKSYSTIYKIDSLFYHFAEIPIKNENYYRYFRYIPYDTCEIHLAEFTIKSLDRNLDINKNYYVGGKSKEIKFDLKNIYDNNIETNFDTPAGYWVGIDFLEKTKIDLIRILVRNDLNIINIGDTYALYFFDLGWHLFSQQIAQKNYLIFENVPSNSLLLLKNLTTGKEERIFIYRGGKQVWL